VPSPRKNVVALAVPVAKRAVPTVPDDKFEAFKLVKFAPLTAPKDPDQVPEVIVPTVAKLAAEVMLGCAAVVTVPAVVAAPLNVAVIVPALKLPEASRATTLEAVFKFVASTAKVLAVEPSNVPPLVKKLPAVKAAVVLAVTVMLAEPLKLTPLIVRAVCRVVAVAALPVVFWLSVGTSAATIALNVGTPAVPFGAARIKLAVLEPYGLTVSP
jgi:hypothetical protein